MNGFKIPITVTGRFSGQNESKNIQQSIDDFIELIVFSANGSFKADYYFGFVFQNTKFQNTDTDDQIESKKIQGESLNKNNYANDLKVAIEEYDTRLKDVRVSIGYNAEIKQVSIDITGLYEEDFIEKDYKNNITFSIW